MLLRLRARAAEVRNDPSFRHPLMQVPPDNLDLLYSGRGTVVAYEPDPESVARLGYTRHDAERAVRAMVPYYRKLIEG